ncbi:MAG: helix-turn-helix transcriptional regulator [Halopseudomonas sp.]
MRLYDGLHHKDVADWHKDLALLTDSLRLDNFSELLCDTLAKVVNFQTVICMTYKKGHAPISIYDNYSPERAKEVIDAYIKGVYVLDPFYTSVMNDITPGVHRLMEMAPDSFEESDYYQQFYRKLNSVEDEVGIFIDLSNDVTLIISLCRWSGLETLTRRERNVLNSIFPMIRSLCREFWRLQAGQYVDKLNQNSPVELAFNTFGDGLLTDREQQIIGLILQGHSSKSVASTLGITPGTVKVHRKNIYTRLKISTQSQLFSQFLNHLAVQATHS